MYEQIKETLGITWNDDVVEAWKDLFSLIIKLLMEAYMTKANEEHSQSYG